LDRLALETNREGHRSLNVGVSGLRAFGEALIGAGEGVVDHAGPIAQPVAGPVTAGPVEQTALNLDRVRT
jgi:hypothetical protein